MRAGLVVVGCIAGFALFVGGVNDAATQQNITTGPMNPLLVAGPLSERIVAYEIDARLDPEAKTIEATETLTYHNRTGRPLREFPFHLYLNGFRRGSTMLKEIRRGSRRFTRRDSQYGEIEVTSLEVEGMGDLTGAMEFVQPDDDNTEDHTVFQVRLPRAVPSGGTVKFKMTFRAKLPEVWRRTGYKRDFFYVAQWFPKVGVWWKGAWNCHQFHASTEFFADFGTYDVRVTVPEEYVVGATGIEVASESNSDGTKTLAFRAEDVHDFAWTANPNFRVIEDTWTGSLGTVKVRLLMSPGHTGQTDRHMKVLKGTLDRFDRWYGPYPYSQITLVDPPHGGGGAGGMEYPTMFTAGTTWWMPEGLRIPEVVTEHEFGHQYWYGMVGSNEFEDAWLDEGINQFTEGKIMESLYGEASMINLLGVTMNDPDSARVSYLGLPDTDPMVRNGWEYMTGGAYGTVTYGKTATVLRTLEGIIGEKTLQEAIRTYFMRYRFTHPTEEDFLQTVEKAAGEDLRWFFDQAVYGTRVMDYAVRTVRSSKVVKEGSTIPAEGEIESETMYDTQVVLHRKGDFIFPVEAEIKFDNGEVVREQWDGRDRWVRFTYRKAAKVVSAEIDPGHKVPLDVDLFNNSRVVKPDTRARGKLANYWLFFTQFFAHAVAWLA